MRKNKMPKVTIVQVIYNSKRFIKPVFEAIFKQTVKDFNVVAVISGNNDGGKEYLAQNFPQIEIVDPGYNIGFAKGHNLVFEKYNSDFFQLINPDLIMSPNYIEEILKVFGDKKVGAATGKLLKFDFTTMVPIVSYNGDHCVIDSTGVTISKSGRARDRGQHEVDKYQYDGLTSVQAVSGAGAMYRREALENIKMKIQEPRSKNQTISNIQYLISNFEYFDEDFHSYWEDVDLAWRMKNTGWKNIYVPSAVAYHGRGAGSSPGGYKDIFAFVKHHRALNSRIRQLNYKNHIFMYIKNSRWFYPQFFVREFFMFIYILIFETATLKILPQMIGLLPKMWKKRKFIKTNGVILSGAKDL